MRRHFTARMMSSAPLKVLWLSTFSSVLKYFVLLSQLLRLSSMPFNGPWILRWRWVAKAKRREDWRRWQPEEDLVKFVSAREREWGNMLETNRERGTLSSRMTPWHCLVKLMALLRDGWTTPVALESSREESRAVSTRNSADDRVNNIR